jgi:hypothetical protein
LIEVRVNVNVGDEERLRGILMGVAVSGVEWMAGIDPAESTQQHDDGKGMSDSDATLMTAHTSLTAEAQQGAAIRHIPVRASQLAAACCCCSRTASAAPVDH